MATFSTNQVRQLYVVNSYSSGTVKENSEVGTIGVKADNDKSHLYFEYRGADNLMRSDLIKIDNIISVTPTRYDKIAPLFPIYTIKLDPNINGGKPIPGQDYILRIAFKQYIGMSDEDQYFKYGMVHAYAGMTAFDFYLKLIESLLDNFSREVTPLIDIAIVDQDSNLVAGLTKEALKNVHTYVTEIKAIQIGAAQQPYRRGIMSSTPADFTCQPTTINVDGDEVVWGTVTKDMTNTYLDYQGNNNINTYKVADLEYFCMGERGDIYRGVGFPHNIPTTYLVDLEKAYHLIDIHYYYSGSNESVQKSEKTITLAVLESGAECTLVNNIISAINTKTGLSVPTLSFD